MGDAADRESFDRLVREHLPAAQRFAVRLTGEVDAAEDLVQEALARAARGWRSFGGRSAFRTWLFQIAVNVFRDGLRARAAAPRRDGNEPADRPDPRAPDPPAEAAAGELGRLVAGFVSALPPRQREVLVLVAYENLSPGEAAAVLGLTPQNVRTNLHLARERLREQLKPYLAGDPRTTRHG